MYTLAAATVLLLGAGSVQAAPAAERFSADSEDFAGFVSRQWNSQNPWQRGGRSPQWGPRNNRPVPRGINVETSSIGAGKVSDSRGTRAKGVGAGDSRVKAQGGRNNFGASDTESEGTAEINGKNAKASGKSRSSGSAFSGDGKFPGGPKESPED